MENKKNGPGIMVEESGEVIAGIFKMDRFPQEKDRDVSESASQVIALEVSDVLLQAKEVGGRCLHWMCIASSSKYIHMLCYTSLLLLRFGLAGQHTPTVLPDVLAAQ